ncbi:hypothetical protein [Parabacteroides distasonis]|uniref:Uncharacterized protein n=1 Tax=Parabacteroides distasonis TaxID=823 RepID=A0A5C6KHU4_PARDI|nr:hypothetical protein [Parabacteroides distasonis]TWV61368.1 hypothetical protein FSA05_12095 [Parabacteroides distasonis]
MIDAFLITQVGNLPITFIKPLLQISILLPQIHNQSIGTGQFLLKGLDHFSGTPGALPKVSNDF